MTVSAYRHGKVFLNGPYQLTGRNTDRFVLHKPFSFK